MEAKMRFLCSKFLFTNLSYEIAASAFRLGLALRQTLITQPLKRRVAY